MTLFGLQSSVPQISFQPAIALAHYLHRRVGFEEYFGLVAIACASINALALVLFGRVMVLKCLVDAPPNRSWLFGDDTTTQNSSELEQTMIDGPGAALLCSKEPLNSCGTV